jgi:hypothetical protein
MKIIRYAFAMMPMVLLLANSSSSGLKKEDLKSPGISSFPNVVIKKTVLNAAELFNTWNLGVSGLSLAAFELAQQGFAKLDKKKLLKKDSVLTIIDYSKPSSAKRLFVLDMITGKILFNSLVAHGRKSGQNYASQFSNKASSYKTSLGFYITLNTYNGGNGYSLRLKGCESGINDKAYNRAIVLHGADYVSENFIEKNGYLGRSYGCPAVPLSLNKEIIEVIKDGSCMFFYYPSKKYSSQSKILNG